MSESATKTDSARERNIEALFPVTPVQAGMLYHTLLAEEPGMYLMQFSCTLTGGVDVDSFQAAWESTVARHQSLRSLILWEGRETPLQLVRQKVDLPWTIQDLRDLDPGRQEEEIASYETSDRTRPFQLDQAPLMRFGLFITADDGARFIWSHHHVVLDGWSLNLTLDEVFRDYALLTSGRVPPDEPGPSFQGFSKYLRDQDRQAARSYWTEYLQGFDEPNQIGTVSAPSRQGSSGLQQQVETVLSPEDTADITAFARRHELTFDTVLRVTWAILVSRYSDDTDVVFGGVVSGRPPELDRSLERVGPFLNTLPVRVRVDPTRPVMDLLTDVVEERLQASPFEWASPSDVQEWSDVPAGVPMYESLVVTENQPGVDSDGVISMSDVDYRQPSNYPLGLFAFPGDSLRLILLHDINRVDQEVARAMLDQTSQILRSIVANPGGTVGELAFFPPAQLEELVEASRGEPLSPSYGSVVAAVRSVASERPHDLAVTGHACDLTYSELMEKAMALASALTERGAGRDERVGIAMERSPGMLVAILGVLLSGGAYLPLDPRAPSNRIASVVDDGDCRIVIADPGLDLDLGEGVQAVTVAVDGALPGRVPDRAELQLSDPDPDSLAYVIYTSGSTGKPKGVAVSHRSLTHSTAARDVAYGETPDAFLLLSPFFFDSSVAGIFWTLTTGGTLVLPAPDMEQDVGRLSELIAASGVTHLLTLPVVYRLLLETSDRNALASLRMAIVAGEPCEPSLAGIHHDTMHGVRLINEYGPTEATVWSTFHEVADPDRGADRVPIGRPIPGSGAFVLDNWSRLAPIGVEGELAVTGPALANGYLGQEELTDDVFVELEVPIIGRTRAYRTGDRARYLETGLLDLLGRADRQIKIRGRRIEPEEIEIALTGHPAIQHAAVELVHATGSDQKLAAFYVSNTGVEPDTLREYLSAALPAYLVPEQFIPIERMPVTPNGKIDRSRLQLPARRVESSKPEHAMSESEALVVGHARDLLGHDRVGPLDNFFEAGGHSLLSMHLIARIFADTGVRVGPNILLFNSLSYAARVIDGDGTGTVEPGASTGRVRIRRDEPSWFGDDALFGILHTPADESLAADEVVVVCPPYGWEYYKTHRALRSLAANLWDRMPVFRFDYRGTGDSFGEPGDVRLAAWVDDVRSAADEARRRTGAERVVLLGLRLGATLALLAAEKPETSDRLILWDPVLDGSDHLRTLESMHAQLVAKQSRQLARESIGEELLGSPYPRPLRLELEALQLSLPSDLPQVDTHLLLSRSGDPQTGLEPTDSDRLRVEQIDDAGGWDDLGSFNSVLLPGPIPRRIVAILEEGA